MEEEKITIRKLTKQDMPYLLKWLTDKKVLEFYEGRDQKFNEERLIEKYYKNDNIIRLIIEYENTPIGYGQIYEIDENTRKELGYEEATIYGIDQYIGNTEYWGKGIGTLYIKKILKYIKQINPNVSAIILDPHKKNIRAIRCYEKSGFQIIKELPKHEIHEGIEEDCYLMEYKYKRR